MANVVTVGTGAVVKGQPFTEFSPGDLARITDNDNMGSWLEQADIVIVTDENSFVNLRNGVVFDNTGNYRGVLVNGPVTITPGPTE
jgi:hypothetical protein